MGGRPLFALAIGGFPDDLPGSEVSDILRGGADMANAAGAPILGGHTITSAEPLYGLAVTGLVDPARIWRNAGARIGDVLVLTKALGTGVVANALRNDAVDDDVLAAAVASMTTLNGVAADLLRGLDPHAVTDVTGFGLLGHLHELAEASGLAAEVDAAAVPAIDGVLELLEGDAALAGGSKRNRADAARFTDWGDAVPEPRRRLLCDAMTSGGLLAAIPPAAAMEGAVIGRLVEGEPGTVSVR
jgi:selenide, water dikinase